MAKKPFIKSTLAASLLLPLPALAQAPLGGVEATTVPVNKPAGVAYDAAGNLYIAVLNDHLIRKIDRNGIITTVAGTGEEGFSGDGGPATAAQLDSPTGIAIDASGTLYIADSHNHRIRKVVNGVITTLAGNGTPGFAGDGAAATAAQLNLPVAVSVDASGNVYVADANNHRIRRITGITITTVAGNGEESFSGDNGPASAAGLDTPNGVAADTLVPGRFFIGDTHNQRVRAVDPAGTITTLAGTGAKTYTGEGPVTATALARPRGLAVGASGTLYVADSDNHRIRSLANGTIATVAGNGEQSFSGDTGLGTNAALDTPRAPAVSLAGALALTDTNNQRIRSVALDGISNTIAGTAPVVTESLLLTGALSVVYGTGSLTAAFANGTQTATGSLTLLEGTTALSTSTLAANTATLSLATLAPGQHTLTATYPGDTGNAPIASGVFIVNVTQAPLTATANPIQVLYGQLIPAPTGTLTGVLPDDQPNVTAVFATPATQGSPAGTAPITVSLAGSAAPKYTVALASGSGAVVIAKAGSLTTLSASTTSLTASVASLTTGIPTGSIQFLNGATPLGTVALALGIASFSVASLPSGTSVVTAAYTGDANFTASTSMPVSAVTGFGDFSLAAASTSLQTILPGRSATFNVVAAPTTAVFNLPITFSATGLPPGATATFTPSTVTPGTASATIAMTIQTPLTSAALRDAYRIVGGTLSVALLFLPFGLCRMRPAFPRLSLALSLFLGLTGVTLLTGCGTGSGFFGQPRQTYTIQVLGTATPSSGPAIQHSTSVTLTVE